MAPVGPSLHLHRRVLHVMGMPVSLALRGDHAIGPAADAAWEQVSASLVHADAVFSTYRDDSAVSRLNAGTLALADAPREVHEVLAIAEQARAESGGAFEVRRPGPTGQRVLDPSGVVKGWAVERAATYLDRLPGTDHCLSAGGDIVVRTARADSSDWKIGIEDPTDPTRLVATVAVRNGGVATSGLVHRGAHIVDPRTGAKAVALASVSVIAPTLTWADIDATAAFVLGDEAEAWLRTRPRRRGVIVGSDGSAQVFAHDGGPRAVS